MVIGASGFIGRGTVLQLLLSRSKSQSATASGTTVVAALRETSPEICDAYKAKLKRMACFRNLAPAEHKALEVTTETALAFTQADVTDAATVREAVRGADVVVNAAGVYKWYHPDQEYYFAVNERGAETVLKACAEEDSGVERLVHISTVLACGRQDGKVFDEKVNIPTEAEMFASHYARTKYLGDERLRAFYGCGGSKSSREEDGVVQVGGSTKKKLDTVILYLACVLGAGDDENLANGRPGAVHCDFINGKIPMLVGPDTLYIYVDVTDVGVAVEKAAVVEMCGEKAIHAGPRGLFSQYLIGNWRQPMTTKEYFQSMAEVNKSLAKEQKCEIETLKENKAAQKLLPSNCPECPTSSLPIRLAFVLGKLGTWWMRLMKSETNSLPEDIMRQALWGPVLFTCEKSEVELGIEYTPVRDAVLAGVRCARAKLLSDIGKASL